MCDIQIRQKTQAIHSLNKRLDELEQAQQEALRRSTDERTKLRSKLKKVGFLKI
jgi:prefoldin subunit 5